jgi:hypothetical protein
MNRNSQRACGGVLLRLVFTVGMVRRQISWFDLTEFITYAECMHTPVVINTSSETTYLYTKKGQKLSSAIATSLLYGSRAFFFFLFADIVFLFLK